MPKIHPTAFVHPTAVFSDDVEIGAYSIVEADVVIGSGTVLHEHAILRRYTTIGQNNIVDSYAVLGESRRTSSSTRKQSHTCVLVITTFFARESRSRVRLARVRPPSSVIGHIG